MAVADVDVKEYLKPDERRRLEEHEKRQNE